jgi:hypothetical protein
MKELWQAAQVMWNELPIEVRVIFTLIFFASIITSFVRFLMLKSIAKTLSTRDYTMRMK